MSNQSHQHLPESMENNNQMNCFFLIGVDSNGELEVQSSWGTTSQQIKIFANLLVAVTNGALNDIIIEGLKEDSISDATQKKNFNIFYKTYKNARNKVNSSQNNPDDLVIDPTVVEL